MAGRCWPRPSSESDGIEFSPEFFTKKRELCWGRMCVQIHYRLLERNRVQRGGNSVVCNVTSGCRPERSSLCMLYNLLCGFLSMSLLVFGARELSSR
jgi:hypothetical protein